MPAKPTPDFVGGSGGAGARDVIAMSQSQDEERAARIAKYKEERRKQLTAKTATYFSSNVTTRRQRKPPERTSSEGVASQLKSSSELNLNTASTSVPIRTTRTSRLRAAAAQTDTTQTHRKPLRSSSVQSLTEDEKKQTKKLIERDKTKINRRTSHEKENLKSASTTCFLDKDNGANKSKLRHSIKSNLDKGKVCSLASSPRAKIGDFKSSSVKLKNSEVDDKNLAADIERLNLNGHVNGVLNSHVASYTYRGDDDKVTEIHLIADSDTELNDSQETDIPNDVPEANIVEDVDVVPSGSASGLLGAVCVRKVERFSELLSNLCSPYEADMLFEDILAENGINGSESGLRKEPECVAPCRRVQPTARSTAAPKRTVAVAKDEPGTVSKIKTRRSIEATQPKTDTLLPSSKLSPKNLSGIKVPSNKSPLSTTPHKTSQKRRSSSTSTKPSSIPVSKKTPEKSNRKSASPVKQDLTKDATPKLDSQARLESFRNRIRKSPEKSKSDTENNRIDRRHRAQKDSENPSGKYQYSKKRLTCLDNSPKKTNDAEVNIASNCLENCKIDNSTETKNEEDLKMSLLHEAVRPHPNSSRLSQEMDNLAALAKQTLDRVNKLSNNLTSNKLHLNSSEPHYDTLFAATSEPKTNGLFTYGSNAKTNQSRGVTERLRDIDSAAQRLKDFEKQSAIFSDLNNDTSSQNRRLDTSSSYCHTPVSILKRKSIHEDDPTATNHAIASPPVTFSPNVVEPRQRRSQRQGILKKRRSLDESQVARRRSCSPEVSFADDGTPDTTKPILKNRRSSLEDVVRNRSPDSQIQGILKRKMSREEEPMDDLSHDSPEPHSILKRKSNSSSGGSNTSSHVSITQAVLLAAAGGAELVLDDDNAVKPILKKKSFSEERPFVDIAPSDTPRPILKKKSIEHDEYDTDLPKKPILKSSRSRLSDDGHTSSFDLSEEDRSSRRPSLLRSRTSDHSGSECETTVRPILKQRGSSLTRERSQSPRPRLSFCADGDANISATNFSYEANDSTAAGPSRVPNPNPEESFPSAVIRRRNLRPRGNQRSRSLACDVNDELLSILNNRRLKVDENCVSASSEPCKLIDGEGGEPGGFPSVAARIKNMEQALTKDQPSTSRSKTRDKERYKTQPITIDEMRSITSSLEPGQASFQAFGTAACSFPNQPAESGTVSTGVEFSAQGSDLGKGYTKILESPIYSPKLVAARPSPPVSSERYESPAEANFLDFDDISSNRKQSTLDEIEQEVNKIRVALDEQCRALDEDGQQAEADNWSLNVSCDSGVYNRASSRDSGPHSGEELGLIESQEIRDNQASNSSSNEWSSSSIERGLLNMERERKSTENDALRSPEDQGSDEENSNDGRGFNLGIIKSNSVIARASMWQQLQQKAKGTPKPLLRHSRSKSKDGGSILAERFKTQPVNFEPPPDVIQPALLPLANSKSSGNVLERDEDAKLDEDDPATMSLSEKMKMFNARLTHKPPRATAGDRGSRLRTMPVLASQVQEAMEQNERLTKSLIQEEIPRSSDFQLKMELFRSASARNTSLEYLMRQNSKFRSLDLDDVPSEPAQRMITPEVRGILKSGGTALTDRNRGLTKGESSEGLKDEGIDSSSDESSASTASCSSKSSSSSSSSPLPNKSRRFQRKNKLKPSRTDSDITQLHNMPQKIQLPAANAKVHNLPHKIQLPGANELKERFAKIDLNNKTETKPRIIPQLGKLARRPSEETSENNDDSKYRRIVKKIDEPIQLAKLVRRDKPPMVEKQPEMKISNMNQAAKNKFFGVEQKQERSLEELAATVRKYIPPVSKSVSVHTLELAGSGSDGESSGGREVRHITTRGRHRFGGGVQRSATHADMPHRGGTIAERLAALQAAGANDWRARVCRISPEKESIEDSKAIERVKNKINESLNSAVEDAKKIQIDENELSANILADRRNKLETAAQGWRKRVPQTDASLFTVAGRLQRDKAPPPAPPPAPLSPAAPLPNTFRSRKPPTSPTNGFPSGPLRSASYAVVSAATVEHKTELIQAKATARNERESFKRSHSVSESISRTEDESPTAERAGCPVLVPRADDESFHAFFLPVPAGQRGPAPAAGGADLDLDAIDSGGRQLLAKDWARRAKRDRKHAASRNPLRALAARTDIKDEYVVPETTHIREQLLREKVTANCGLAAEALAALASKEDFSSVSLRSAAAPSAASTMLLQVKGRRRVQTRLVSPVHTSVNRGDCFVLVTADQLFLYIGLYANVIERNRSTDIAVHIFNTKDLNCKLAPTLIKIDEQNKNYSAKHWNQFWTLLGVKEDVENYRPTETGHPEEDEIYESCIVQTNMCYEVVDDELVPIKEYWGQVPKIAMLNQSKIIVYDFGSEMYIWYGKNVPLESRRRAAQLAQELFDDGYNYEECHINPLNAAMYQGARESNGATKSAKTRPEWAIISKITQHMETILFKEKFLDWPDYSRVIKVKPQENKANSVEITPCDADEMWSNEYQDPDLILEGSHIGRGNTYFDKENNRQYDIKTKSLCKWEIQEYDYQKVENENDIGDFFSGDSYIIRWEYQITMTGRELNGKPSKHNITGRDRCAYFCWQGRDASSNEKGAAALLTVELDKEKGPQVRVAQGNEPPAFLNLFQGNLAIHQGKRSTDKNRYKLFVTRGNMTNEAYLLQVPCSVRQLRSRGSLLLVDTENACLYIWHGSRSMKHTKNIAIELANKLIARKCSYLFGDKVSDIKITEVKEGEEPKSVLDALGVANKQYYNSVLSVSRECDSVASPRLFQFTDLSGQFEAHEVLSPLRHESLVTPFPFEQKELYSASQPALFLLDDGRHVWLWQGWWPPGDNGDNTPDGNNGALSSRWQSLRLAALRSASAYLRASGRGGDVSVAAAGLEPEHFVQQFDKWQESDEAAAANIALGFKPGEALSCGHEMSRLAACDVTLPLAVLQRRPLPDHVDPARLERHLVEADFVEAFGMSKEEFANLPAWKQTNMKKDLGLF